MLKKPAAALFGPALVLMSGRALGFIASFVIPLVLTRHFGQHEFGTYKQLFLVYSTLFGIMQAGMAESLYYFLPAATERKGSYVLNVQLVLTALGAVALVLLEVEQDTISNLLNNDALAPYLGLTGCYLLLMLASLALEIVLTAEKQHVAASVSYALSDLGRAALFLLPVLAFGDLFHLWLGAIAFALARLGITLYYLKRHFGKGLCTDHALLVRQFGYALPFGMAGLIEVIQVNFHMYVVSWHFDAAAFAVYSVGCLQLPITDYLMTSVSNVMMVNMREQLGAGDREAVQAIWLDAVRKLALVLCPLVGVLLVLSRELILLLFTSAYAGSVPVFIVWTLSMLPAVLLTDSLLRVHAENRFLIVQNLLRLAFIAMLIQSFLQWFGMIGAVLVTLLAGLATKTLALWRVRTLLQVTVRQLLPWRSLSLTLAISAAAMLPVLLLKSVIELTGLPLLMLAGTLYLLGYALLLWWYGPLHGDEKKLLVQHSQLPVAFLRKAWKV